MSLPGPYTPSTGDKVPVSHYVASITDNYPRVNRNRLIESSIAGREKVEILPVNLNAVGKLDGGFLEFRIPGISNRFIDTSKINLEMKITIKKAKGLDLEDDDTPDVPQNFINSIFRSCQVYLGEKLVESNPYFNYSSNMKLLQTFKSDTIDSLGHLGNIDNTYSEEVDTFTAVNYPGTLQSRLKRINLLKTTGMQTIFPLFLDIASLDQYLLDGIPMRIRLELASSQWIINSVKVDKGYYMQIDDAKLWIEKVIPHTNSLLALNQTLGSPGNYVDYVFNRTLFKNISIPANQTSIIVDMPWNTIIPNTLSFIVVDLDSFNGNYNRNAMYLQNADITEVRVTVNGAPIYSVNCKFPHFIAQAYYETLNAIGLSSSPLLTYKAFQTSKTMFCMKFETNEVEDTLPIEKSGNLRISISLGSASNRNRVLLINGDTVGIIKVDSERNLLCDVRA